MAELDKHGQLTIGHIVRHRVYTLGRGTLCFVSYYYRSKEQDYNHEQEVDNDHFNTLEDGERVCVRYLPQNPHLSMLAVMIAMMRKLADIVGQLSCSLSSRPSSFCFLFVYWQYSIEPFHKSLSS